MAPGAPAARSVGTETSGSRASSAAKSYTDPSNHTRVYRRTAFPANSWRLILLPDGQVGATGSGGRPGSKFLDPACGMFRPTAILRWRVEVDREGCCMPSTQPWTETGEMETVWTRCFLSIFCFLSLPLHTCSLRTAFPPSETSPQVLHGRISMLSGMAQGRLPSLFRSHKALALTTGWCMTF